MPFSISHYNELDDSDICRSRAFTPLLYLKCNLVAFIERLEPFCIDCGEMNEYIRTIFLLDEAKAFSVIKPLYGSISHSDTLLYSIFHGSQLQAITIDKTDPSFRKKPAP
jgi:hypothetical protein